MFDSTKKKAEELKNKSREKVEELKDKMK